MSLGRALLIAALVVLGVAHLPSLVIQEAENLHAHQAQAFLAGRLDIPAPLRDVAVHDGRYYVPFPPFPAVVLLPFVALLGTGLTNVKLVALALTALNIVVLRRLLLRLEVDPDAIPWLLAAFFLGTGYWLAVVWSGGVWYFAHLVAVTCMLLALHAALCGGRAVLAGLFVGLAFLSRQLAIYLVLFLIVAVWQAPRRATPRERLLRVALFLVPVAACIGVYLAFNQVRFAHPLDTGYLYIFDGGKADFSLERVRRFGLFHPVYVPFNFVHLFLQGFHVEFDPPAYLRGLRMSPFGTSITFASPFVFAAFWSRWQGPLRRAAWVSIGLAVTHMLLYCNNGWVQINAQRFTLDVLPLLILLVASATREIPGRIWKAAVVYAVALNALALIAVPLVARVLRWW